MHPSLLRPRFALLIAVILLGVGAQAPAALALVDAAAPPDAVNDAGTVRSGNELFLDLTANDSDPDNDPLTITSPTPGEPVATAHGTVECSSSFCMYYANAGDGGPDSFNYTISDGTGGTDSATVSITVLANTPPDAVDDAVSVRSGHAEFLDLTGNDSDADDDWLTITSPTPGEPFATAHGTVECDMFVGVCEYISIAGYGGPDSFTYTISDENGGTDTATVSITVVVNTPPDAVDDAETVRSGLSSFLDPTGNDSDSDDDTLELTSPTPGEPFATAHGTVECGMFGGCEYVSIAGYGGPDSFTYTVSDGYGGSDSATVSITVVANTPPTAVDDELEATSGTPVSGFILENDIDPDVDEGDEILLTAPTPDVATDTPHGTVTCANYGECEYTSDAGYVGPDGFDYTVADGSGASDVGHVAITVSANGAPHAEDDRYLRGDELVLDVLDNDSDDENDPLEIVSVTQPAGGTAEISADKLTIVYRQTSNFTADDSFTYTVTDPGGATDTATVTLDACAGLSSALDSGGIVVGERWVACSAERASGAVGPTTTVFPPQGATSALLTSGDIAQAPGPNNSTSAGANNQTDLRGAFDVSILRLDLLIPAGANCLSFDLAFQSEEFPEYVGLGFNDAFLAELDASTWSVAGSTITAPDNFAFDSGGGIVSVNSAFFEPGRVVTATGSQYDGSTPLLNVRRSITPGAHALYLSIFDAGDHAYDSAAFVDGLTAGPAGPGGCAAGANESPLAVDDAITTGEDTQPFLNVLGNDTDPDNHPITLTTLNPTADHGTVACSADGACTYTPAPNYFGPDSFTYTISDGHGGTDMATVSISVTPVQDDPTAVADTISTTAGTPAAANVLANDFDVDGDTPLTIQSFTQGQHGTVTCTGSDCTYTPAAGYSGPDSFTYTISDGHGGTAVGTVSVTVTGGNDPPVADDDSLTTAEDTTGNVNVLDGDVDPDGDTLTVTTPSPIAAHGTVSCTAAGVCTYTPAANYNGSDSFTYTVSDGHGGTDTATVSVTVTAVNDDPNAVDNVLMTAEDLAGNLNVLANDTDVDGDTLTVTTPTPTAQHGTVACTAVGVCTYTPDANFNGSDSFTYAIADGHGGTDTASVSVTVTPVNDTPDAVNNALTTDEDTAKVVSVLGNDTDVDGDSLTVTTPSPTAAHGTVACTAAGECTYTPAANYHGPDSFTYGISDGHGGTDTATVSMTVTPVNDPPNAVDDSFTTAQGTVKVVNVFGNDSDPDSPFMLTSTTQPANGSVFCSIAGDCTYMPNPGFSGSDSFTYTIGDGQSEDTATVSMAVTPPNQPPVADDETLETPEDTVGQVNVLTGDTDSDGDPLTVTSLNPTASHGTVACTAAGVCTYTPNANYNGSDEFDYTVSDGHGGTDTGHVTITVTSVNDTPDAVNNTLTTDEDTAKVVSVLGNDTDVDGDSLTVTTAAPTAAHGTVACTAAGECTYTPAANYHGPDLFTYGTSDGNGGTDTATVAIIVTSVNDLPNAVDDSFTTTQDTLKSVNVFGNDSDDGAFQLASNTQPAHGSVHCTVAGDCTYTPAAGYHGPDSFTYTIGDGPEEDTATVSITVTPATPTNTPPSCASVKPSKTKLWPPRHKFVVITLSGATDADGDPLAFSITKVTQDEKVKGAITKNDKGPDAKRVPGKPHQVELRAERIASGNGRVYRIHYTVSDGQGGTCSGIVKVGVPRNKNGNAIDNVSKRYNSFG